MRKILFFIILLRVNLIAVIIGFTVVASAQQGVAINTDGTNADNSALLDIKSNSKGILIPRLTAAQKTAISSPATGLLIYQTNGTAGFYYYSGSAWLPLSAAAGPLTGWSTTGNNGTDSSVNFIGTMDLKPLVGKVNGEQTFYFSPTTDLTFIGYQAGKNNTTGYWNHFSGKQAGYSNTTGHQNHFEGFKAGYSNTTGDNNQFIGTEAGISNTTGEANFFVGNSAGHDNTTGQFNHFNGFLAGFRNTTGYNNQFEGNQAGYSNTTGHMNYFSGLYSGTSNTTGNNNYIAGYSAGVNNVSGSNNFFIGYETGNQNNTSNYNHFVGNQAGYWNTAMSNFFEGYQAGFSNTTASYNHFVGNQAGYSNTGMSNFFEGFRAGYSNTTGTLNYFSGLQAGYFNTTASQNHFVGYQAGFNNSTGQNNHFAGFAAGTYNTTGSDNQFEGNSAGYSNTTGSQNYFSGYEAGFANKIGSYNYFAGYKAGASNSASGNHLVGFQAGYSNTTGNSNHFSGFNAGYHNTSGSNNFYEGYLAGYNNLTGSNNVFIGNWAGYYETGSNKLYVSNSNSSTPLIYGDFPDQFVKVNGVAQVNKITTNTGPILQLIEAADQFGVLSFKNANKGTVWNMKVQSTDIYQTSQVVFEFGGINAFKVNGIGNAVLAGTLTQNSDKRLKKNIIPLKNPLQKIMNVSGYTYNWIDSERDHSEQIGFIAQDLEKEFPQLVKTDDKGMKSVAYANMVPILVEAIKEQQKQIDELKKMIELLSKK